MIRNIMSNNDKGLGTIDVLPIGDYRASVMNGELDYKQVPLGAYDLFGETLQSKNDYIEDIKLLQSMGFNAYSLSLSWTRIFPNGDETMPNEEGLKFYENIIDEILKREIEPIVTLSHFDIPLNLYENYGAWSNRKMITFYEKYCQAVFSRFKNKVRYWITFNEMNILHHLPFVGAGLCLENVENREQLIWQAAHYQLVASAKAVRLGKTINPDFQIGSMFVVSQAYGQTENAVDAMEAEVKNRENYFFTDVQVRGYYPNHFLRRLEREQLVLDVDNDDLFVLKDGTIDFVAFSYYPSANSQDVFVSKYVEKTSSEEKIDPVGLRVVMNNLYDRYQKPLFVVENNSFALNDGTNAEDLKENVQEIIKTVEFDGIDLLGYTPLHWVDLDI
ncbi:aryl-phospho-beta-D-glucosidase BglH [Streptococcus sp. oral taxon 056 str. F0418]|uniref:family 1 glycosylhydrolase n=1 Tax=Streptococcus sp. oral taxon 056 TaxID=712620 RepID=UPI0002180B86|nr:family 1 glycosylhydrolase [Streptococcus sp. oral taxon 056]EGP65861.1 aryl-phospho-beta-D-glucosidase BglH [Streptococcus sp. oral taxon 056 str. F0418]